MHQPNRRWAAAAKVAVVVAFAFVAALLGGLLALVLIVTVYNSQRPDVGLGVLIAIILAQAAKTVAWAVLTALIALISRSTVISSVATLALAWVVEPAIRTATTISGADGWVAWIPHLLPFTAANAFTVSSDSAVFASNPLGPWWSAMVVLAWISILIVATDSGLQRRSRAPSGSAGGSFGKIPIGES